MIAPHRETESHSKERRYTVSKTGTNLSLTTRTYDDVSRLMLTSFFLVCRDNVTSKYLAFPFT